MQCALGCKSLAIGVANIAGKPGTPPSGTKGSYALCQHHYAEIIEKRWANVVLEGWEGFPDGKTISEKV